MLLKMKVFKAVEADWKSGRYQVLTLLDAGENPLEQMCQLATKVDNAPVATADIADKTIMVMVDKIDVRDSQPSFRGSYVLAGPNNKKA